MLQTIDSSQTITVSEEETHIYCGADVDDCYNCPHLGVYVNDTNTGTYDRCEMPEEEKIHETETHSIYDGSAEDVPYKLMDANVLSVYAYIRGQGKNGRKKHGTAAVIEIKVK